MGKGINHVLVTYISCYNAWWRKLWKKDSNECFTWNMMKLISKITIMISVNIFQAFILFRKYIFHFIFSLYSFILYNAKKTNEEIFTSLCPCCCRCCQCCHCWWLVVREWWWLFVKSIGKITGSEICIVEMLKNFHLNKLWLCMNVSSFYESLTFYIFFKENSW